MNSEQEPTTSQDALAFLQSNGEMGQRIRTFNWANTPLGPIEQWSQSLRASVQIMLNSRYPMFIWWGSELINLYNDAYIPVLGQRHPAALGGHAPKIWSDVWPIVGPQSEIVLNEGRATWNEELLLIMQRNHFLEETYFTFSYSPAPDDHGGTGGVFCVCTEDTQRVLSQRRMRTLRELAEKAGQTKSEQAACTIATTVLAENPYDLPFVLLYLLDEDGQWATLVGQTGFDETTSAAPKRIDLHSHQTPWPFNEVAQNGTSMVVEELPQKCGRLPGGAWPESPEKAVVLPLKKRGHTELAGFVVTGLSPRLIFTEEYQAFLELLTGHIATAVANARAFEEERRRADALAELDRTKTAFFSNVSHEFRTPLTLILGPVEDMLSKQTADLSPEATEQLEVVQRNSLRLLKLVNTMLDFSRIEGGRLLAHREPVDLAEYTADLASTFRSTIERAGLRLVVSCSPLPEPVYIDIDMWEKIILNLLSNAFKFTMEGEIEVRLEKVGNQAQLTVRDTGIGIPAEEMPLIFDRFHRVKNVRGRTHEGTGIGLALVQELVKLHGGTIEATSVLNEGSCFTVSIPLDLPVEQNRFAGKGHSETVHLHQKTHAQAFVEESQRWLMDREEIVGTNLPEFYPEETAVTASSRPPTRHRILWADDNADMRDYVSRLLEDHFDVEAVADGAAALQAAQTNPPDLILSDIMMPKLDGFELLRALRADPDLQQIPIILLSARAGEDARIEGMEIGADDYLIKPFSARELLTRINAHLRLARIRQRAETAVRESEAKLQRIVNHAPIAIAVLKGEDLRYVSVNPTYQTVIGSNAEMIGKTIYEVFPDATDRTIEKNLREVIRTGQPWKVRDFPSNLSSRAETTWWEGECLPLPNESGQIDSVLVLVWEITERKQAEVALKKNEQQYRTLSNQLKGLLEATSRLIDMSETSELFTSLLNISKEIVDVNAVGVWRLDEQNKWRIIASTGLSDEFLKQSVDAAGNAAPSPEPVIIQPDDLINQSNPNLQKRWQHYEREGIRSLMILPLLIHGQMSGTLVYYSHTPHVFTELEIELAQALANIAASAITTAELYEIQTRLRQTAEEAAVRESFLAAAGAILSESLDYKQTLTNVAQVAVPRFADWCAVDLLDHDEEIKRLAVAHIDQEKVQLAHDLHEQYGSYNENESAVLRVLSSGKPELVPHIPEEQIIKAARNENHLRTLEALKLTSYICVPLQTGDKIYGTITFVTAESGRHFEQRDLSIAQEIASRASQAIDNARLYNSLSEREKQLRLTLTATKAGVWELDVTSRKTRWSIEFEMIFGYDATTPRTYEQWVKSLHPEDRELVEANLKQRLTSEQTEFQQVYRIIHPQLGLRWILDLGYIERDSQKRPLRALGISADITERKEAEEALQKSEDQYHLLFNSIDEGFCVIELIFDNQDKAIDYRLLKTNPMFEKHTGLENAEGKTIRDLVPDLEEHWFDIYGKVAQTGEPSRFIDHSEAMGRWFDVYAFRVDDTNKNEVAVLFQDITDRKRVEQALRESEQRFRLATSAGGVGVWDWDIITNKVTWSESLYKIHGLERDEFGGTVEAFGELIYPDDRAYVNESIERALHKNEAYEIEFRAVRPDGEIIWIYTHARVVLNEEGQPIRMLGGTVDITERKQTEEELLKLNKLLEQRVADRTKLLKQQNKSLRQLAQQLTETEQRERRKLAQMLHDGLQQILVGAKMQLALSQGDQTAVAMKRVTGLLDEAIATSRSLSYELSPPILYSSDLPDALEWLAQYFQTTHHFAVKIKADQDLPTLSDNIKVFLFHAIRELLLNAVKHSGTHVATVEIRNQDSKLYHVTVFDNGKGFDPRDLDVATGDLHGFGLFSIRERLAALGGEFQIESKPGAGAKFIFKMKVRPS